MLVTLSGMSIELKLVHPLNVDPFISDKLVGSFTKLKD